MIYFARCSITGYVKVGFSDQPRMKRLKDLQTGNAAELILEAEMPGDEAAERKLHTKWHSRCVRKGSEWFNLSIAEVVSIAGPTPADLPITLAMFRASCRDLRQWNRAADRQEPLDAPKTWKEVVSAGEIRKTIRLFAVGRSCIADECDDGFIVDIERTVVRLRNRYERRTAHRAAFEQMMRAIIERNFDTTETCNNLCSDCRGRYANLSSRDR